MFLAQCRGLVFLTDYIYIAQEFVSQNLEVFFVCDVLYNIISYVTSVLKMET
jgi:hypothetical protein